MGMWRAGVRVLALRVRASAGGYGHVAGRSAGTSIAGTGVQVRAWTGGRVQAWACVLCGDGRAGVC